MLLRSKKLVLDTLYSGVDTKTNEREVGVVLALKTDIQILLVRIHDC